MKTKILLFFMLSFSACDRTRSASSATFIGNTQADTIVVSKTIPDEIAAFEFSQKEYFLVAGKDTSGLSYIFSVNKNSGDISITLEYNDLYKISFYKSSVITQYRLTKRLCNTLISVPKTS